MLPVLPLALAVGRDLFRFAVTLTGFHLGITRFFFLDVSLSWPLTRSRVYLRLPLVGEVVIGPSVGAEFVPWSAMPNPGEDPGLWSDWT